MFIKFDDILLNLNHVVGFYRDYDKELSKFEIRACFENHRGRPAEAYQSWDFDTEAERDRKWNELCLLAENQFKANF